jgi:hypothetical protein
VDGESPQLVERHSAPLVFRHAAHAQSELDVVDDVEPRHQRVLLEHDAAVGAGAGDRLAVEHDGAGRGFHETGDARQQRRLPAARCTQRHHEVAGVERVQPGPRGLCHPVRDLLRRGLPDVTGLGRVHVASLVRPV